jgi:hypothetical protein
MDSPGQQHATAHQPEDPELSAEAKDPVIEAFKRDIDFSLVERNLRLTTEERAQQLVNATRFIGRFRPLVSGKAE